MAIGQPYNGMKKRKEKRKQKRVGERKKDMRIPGIKEITFNISIEIEVIPGKQCVC